MAGIIPTNGPKGLVAGVLPALVCAPLGLEKGALVIEGIALVWHFIAGGKPTDEGEGGQDGECAFDCTHGFSQSGAKPHWSGTVAETECLQTTEACADQVHALATLQKNAKQVGRELSLSRGNHVPYFLIYPHHYI